MRARTIWRPEVETRARLRVACFADVVTVLWILTTSSAYWADEGESAVGSSELSAGTSKNSVSPSLSSIVSHVLPDGLQVPSPWATTPESTMHTAALLSLSRPR